MQWRTRGTRVAARRGGPIRERRPPALKGKAHAKNVAFASKANAGQINRLLRQGSYLSADAPLCRQRASVVITIEPSALIARTLKLLVDQIEKTRIHPFWKQSPSPNIQIGKSRWEPWGRCWGAMAKDDEPEVQDEVPWSDEITDYDRAHFVTYLRLLDATRESANPDEIVQIVLGIDPAKEPERAKKVLDSHLKRARWMTEHGYKHLLQ